MSNAFAQGKAAAPTAKPAATAPTPKPVAEAPKKPKPPIIKGSFLDVCKDEIVKHCSKRNDQTSVETRACLLTNIDHLSKKCEEVTFNQQANVLIAISENPECLADARKFCNNLAGSKSLLGCLKDHHAQLSKDCRETQDTEYKNKSVDQVGG